ncbi:MAG TPA: hypothetical protein VGE35_03100 [Candidatus Paceibacterota bacterium]
MCASLFLFEKAEAYVIAPQEIITDAVWTKELGPYLVFGELKIGSGATLTISPGTVVALQGEPITIQGTFRIVGDPLDKIRFVSISESSLPYPETITPSTAVNLQLEVDQGSVSIENVDIPGTMFIGARGGGVSVRSATARSTGWRLSSGARIDFDNVHLGNALIRTLSDGAELAARLSSFPQGYWSIRDGARLNLVDCDLTDFGGFEISGGYGTFEKTSFADSSGSFAVQAGGSALFKDSLIRDFSANKVFEVSGHSSVLFESSRVSPVRSDFALLKEGSVLAATSTIIENVLNGAIQGVGRSRISLYDTSLRNTLSGQPSAFLVLLAGSTLSADKSIFSSSTGFAIGTERVDGLGPSELDIRNSVISDYGNVGVFAGHATGTLRGVEIRKGGIGVMSDGSHLDISNSSFAESASAAVENTSPSNAVIAKNNFWGDASGPGNQSSNPEGRGDRVSEGVIYSPWLSYDPNGPCCSSVLFVPGFQATRLYSSEGDGVRLWEPSIVGRGDIRELFLNDRGQSMRSDIVAKEIIDEALAPVIGSNIYKSFIADMDALKLSGTFADWRPFPYDWRFSVDDIVDASDIVDQIRGMAESSKTGRVTIIAHSNGGLVAKAIMLRLRELGIEYLVDTLALVASPQSGTPLAIGALLHGFDQGIPLLAPTKEMRVLGQNMPGAYGLLPSPDYFREDGQALISFDASSTMSWMRNSLLAFGESILSYASLNGFLKAVDGRFSPESSDLASPSVLNSGLIDSGQEMHRIIDGWVPPMNLRVIQIAGQGEDTVSGLRYYEGRKRGEPVLRYDPLFTSAGDETVVASSALSLFSLPQVSSYIVDLAQANLGLSVRRSHADILELAPVRDLLQKIIAREPDSLRIEGVMSLSDDELSEDQKSGIRLLLHSDAFAMSVYDSFGNHTGISTSTGRIEELIPNSSYGRFGDVAHVSIKSTDSSSLRVAMQPSFHIMIRPADVDRAEREPYTLDVVRFRGNEVVSSISYIDIPASASSISSLDVSGQEIPSQLMVDQDGDGDIDIEFIPGLRPESEPDEAVAVPVEISSSKRGSGRAARIAIGLHDAGHLERAPRDVASSEITETQKPAGPNLTFRMATGSPRANLPTTLVQTASVFQGVDGDGIKVWLKAIISRLIQFAERLKHWAW